MTEERREEYERQVRAPTGEEKDSNVLSDEVRYPEGGREGWLCVLGSFTGLVAALGMMNSLGVYHGYLIEHQLRDYSESTVSWIFSVYIFLSFFCGLQIGPVFDAHGPKLLVLSGSILICLSMFLLGICVMYWQFFLVFAIGGLGTSLIFTPALAAVSHFFHEKRGNATGIAAAGGSLGGVICPLALQQLFPRVGFAWATRIVGFIYVACCITACLFIKSRLPPKQQSVLPDFRVLRNSSYALLIAAIFLMEWALFVPITYLASFAYSSRAMTQAFSYQLIAIFNAGSCIGRWVPGLLADRLGRFNCIIGAVAVCAMTSLAFWLPAAMLAPAVDHIPTTAGTASTIKTLSIVYSVVFGFASGSNISLTPVCVGQLCDTSQFGRYYATCYTVVSFSTLTGVPIAGTILGGTPRGRYWGVVIWTTACYIAALFLFIWSRSYHVGWKLRKF